MIGRGQGTPAAVQLDPGHRGTPASERSRRPRRAAHGPSRSHGVGVGVPAERDAHVAVGQRAHRGEDVARLERARRAGRAAGDREPAPVQLGDECLAVDVEAREGHQVGEPVDRRRGTPRCPGSRRAASASWSVRAGVLRGEPRSSSMVARSAAAAASAAGTFSKPGRPLVDAVVPGERVAPAGRLADQQHPDARGAAPLVGRGGGRRPALGQRQPPGRGAGVDEERRAGQRGDLLHRLARRRPRGWRTARRPRPARRRRSSADAAASRSTRPARSTASVSNRPPRAGVPGAGVQDGGVLDLRGQQQVAVASPAREQTEHAEVAGMGPARGEGDLVGAYAEAVGDDGTGVVEHQPGVAGGAVQAPRVGVPTLEGLEQDLARGGVQRRTRRVIEVRRNRGARNVARRGRRTFAHRAKPTGAPRGDRGVVSSRVSLIEEGLAVQK